MMIRVWHCYYYGPHDTYIILAESEDALKEKIRAEITAGWYPEDDGPLPDDYDEMMEAYMNLSGYHGSYFGDYGWTEVNGALCEEVVS